MGIAGSRQLDEPYQPSEYNDDREIPFAPDGNGPLIAKSVEKVKGTSGQFRGLKCVRKTVTETADPDPISCESKKRKLVQEAKILHYARHQHVVRLIHTYFDNQNEDEIKFAVIMDRADRNLQEYLKVGKHPDMQWFGCLIHAVHHIHTLGIRHRDIKPNNVLIKEGRVLLADFGISKMGLGETMPTTHWHRNPSRTREYCAPEVDNGSTRGRSADVFSLGAVFLEMLVTFTYPEGLRELSDVLSCPSQHKTSYAQNIDQVHKWIGKLHPVGWQNDALSACQKMLNSDREKRPLAKELESTWSVLSASNESLACNCTTDVVLTKNDQLVEACQKGLEDMAGHLVNEGADASTTSAIHYAAENGSKAIVQLLLDRGAGIDSPNPIGQSALHCAARSGHDDVVKLLLENGASVNAKDENDQTALQGAAGQGYSNIVRILLDYGADVDAEDLNRKTAFHFANRRHHTAVLELLEENKHRLV